MNIISVNILTVFEKMSIQGNIMNSVKALGLLGVGRRGTSASLTLLYRQHPDYIPIRVRAFRRQVLHRLMEIEEDPSVSALSRVDIMLFFWRGVI